jgi:acyl-coenzyme A synthetase/AMP-(fatty) acid ligase
MSKPTEGELKKAYALVQKKGRCYLQRKQFVTLKVWSKYRVESQFLAYALGGNFYKHRAGYLWIMAHPRDVIRLKGKINTEEKRLSLLERIFSSFETPSE